MDKKNRIKKRLQDFKLPALRKIAREMGIPDVDKLRSSDLIEVISEHTDVGTINKKLKINYPLKIVKIISIILSVIGVIGPIIGLIVDSPTFISMVKKPFINSNAILHNFPKEVESSNKLKILVLPFRSYDSNKIDIGKAINKRLSELDTSSMSSYYLESYIPGGNFNADSASQILKESGFDMIIFGEQISGRCNEGTTDEACINYIVNEKHQNFLKEESKNITPLARDSISCRYSADSYPPNTHLRRCFTSGWNPHNSPREMESRREREISRRMCSCFANFLTMGQHV